ncbi:MAG: hypothetical protein KC912_05885 [Proteobacteria bacterium]|nr:hypothetical protein [Pseudomonadota bacterium]
MRGLLIVSLALLGACKDDGTEETGSSGPTAPEVTTDPADEAQSDADVSPVIVTESEGGDVSYSYSWLSDAGVEWGEETLAASATAKGQEWTLTVTPSAGGTNGTSAQATVAIVNTPPTVSSAEFIPSVPTVGTDLSCIPISSNDYDADSLTFSYAWTKDGSAISETSNTLPGSEVASGVTIECALTPNDGEDDGNTVTVSGVANNAPPTATGSTLSPTSIISTEDLTCAGVGGADPDGDTVTFVYEWTVNGTVVSETGATLAASNYVHNDVVICTAVPFDGASEGTGVASTSITVGNAPPTVSLASIGPTGPFAADTLTCTPTGSDPDGGSPTWTYTWTVNGNVLTSETTDSLASGNFVYDDAISCSATLTDEGGLSASASSFTIYIENTPPVVTGVAISPSTASASDALTCSYGATADADGQSVGVTYSWTVNGNAAGTGATLAAGSASRGQTVVCSVTPNDGVSNGSAGTASITVQNDAPPTPTATITPNGATTSDALTCSASPTVDADGDTITYSYAWFDGTTALGTGATLSAGLVVRGDTVRCEATGNDGTVDGPMGSGTLVISNTAPTLATATLSPTSANSSTTFGCTPGGSDDLDGDQVSYIYRWTAGGNTINGATSNSLTGANFSGGDVIQCHITPTDTYDPGSEVSSGTVTVQNSVPGTFTATVTPTSPEAQADDLICSGTSIDPDGDALTYAAEWEWEDYGLTARAWSLGVENSGASGRTNDAVNAADTVAGRRFRCRLTASDGGTASTTTAYSAWVTAGSPPGCGPTYDGSSQLAGPYLAHNECFYQGGTALTCDQTCSAAGLSNSSLNPHNAWPDACSGGPGAEDPTTWFFEHGNPNNGSSVYSYASAGLGYTYSGGVYTGKCNTNTPSWGGTYEGERSPGGGISLVCSCGEQTAVSVGGTTSTPTNSWGYGSVYKPTKDMASFRWGALAGFPTVSGCSLDWYIYENVDGNPKGPWTRLYSGQMPAVSTSNTYYYIEQDVKLYAGRTYLWYTDSACAVNQPYTTATGNTPVGTHEGFCQVNGTTYTGYSTAFAPTETNCSAPSTPDWAGIFTIAN